MRSLLRKKPEATPQQVPAWHPNFRNFERLPDTKVVRTAFFVNGIAITISALMLLWFTFQAFQLRDVQRQINDVEAQIQRDRGNSERAIALYKKFEKAAARAAEVEAFVKSRPSVSGVLLRLAETLPANIALDRFDLRETSVSLRGSVRGAPDQASGHASAFLDLLKADRVLGAQFDEITLVDLSRNPQTGRLSFEMSLRLKNAKEAKKR